MPSRSVGVNGALLLPPWNFGNAAAARLHGLWSKRTGTVGDDPAWSSQVRALEAEIATAYEARRRIRARRAGRPDNDVGAGRVAAVAVFPPAARAEKMMRTMTAQRGEER